MTRYYRYTDTNNPMSDWGHAMFIKGEDGRIEVEGTYGDIGWIYDGTGAVDINDLRNEIINAWEEDRAEGFAGDFGNMPESDYWTQFDGEEIFEEFNPENIIDHAQAYDSELCMWIWERILEPKGIMAVITRDGAVVFDEELIKPYEEDGK